MLSFFFRVNPFIRKLRSGLIAAEHHKSWSSEETFAFTGQVVGREGGREERAERTEKVKEGRLQRWR